MAAAAHAAQAVEELSDHLHAADGVHLDDAGHDHLIDRLAQALIGLS
jgi:hypothetical protein